MTKQQARKAADFLDAVALSVMSGWGQGEFWDLDNQPCCVVGHRIIVREESRVSDDVATIARDAMEAAAGTPLLERWNDALNRTQDDVIKLCHRAAYSLRHGGQL